LTLLSRRDSHPVVSRNPGPLRIADLAGLLGDRVDPSQVPSQTHVMTRLLPTIPRARNDTTHDVGKIPGKLLDKRGIITHYNVL